MLMSFARPETILYTNLGMGQAIDEALRNTGQSHLMDTRQIIAAYHGRGKDELVHRALKDFGFEQLPFKRFSANAAFYYTMLASFFLYEGFKLDVCAQVLEPVCYATILWRQIIDMAAKFVSHGGKIILKITKAACEQIDFFLLWAKSGAPPNYCWT